MMSRPHLTGFVITKILKVVSCRIADAAPCTGWTGMIGPMALKIKCKSHVISDQTNTGWMRTSIHQHQYQININIPIYSATLPNMADIEINAHPKYCSPNCQQEANYFLRLTFPCSYATMTHEPFCVKRPFWSQSPIWALLHKATNPGGLLTIRGDAPAMITHLEMSCGYTPGHPELSRKIPTW